MPGFIALSFSTTREPEGTARLVARDEHAVIADFVRVDMLETTADLHHAVDMGTALVRKRRIAHVRGMHVARQIHNLVHVAAQLAEPCNLFRGKELRAHLEMQVGSNRREVRVSATLAVTVHHALHHGSAALHGKQAVAHAQARVVMHVDADRRRNDLLHVLHNLLEFPRHRAAVRIAKHDKVRAAAFSRLQRLESVFRVRLVAVKEMFRIVNHLFGMVLEVVDGRLDHVEILLERRADNVGDVQIPALSENRLDRGARLHERLQQRVLLGQHLRAARGTECGNLLEEFLVGRVARIGPAPFDVVKTEMVKNSRNLQLVGERKAYLAVLVTVAEGRVV